jgi:hypothetical protein
MPGLGAPRDAPSVRRGDAKRDPGKPSRGLGVRDHKTALAVHHQEDLLHEVVSVCLRDADPSKEPRNKESVLPEKLFCTKVP